MDERQEWVNLDGRLQSIQFLLEVIAAMTMAKLEKSEQDAAITAIYTRLSEGFSVPPGASPALQTYLGDVHGAAEEHLGRLLQSVSTRADGIREGEP